jgi:inner membrane protein
MSRTGLDRWNRHAAWTAVIASNLPDIDIAAGLYDMPAYIEYHRGITHAIAGIPILSLALAAAMYRFTGNLWRTFVVALLAMSTHPALDYLNTYGLRPFLPFDEKWIYGDALFIFDPVFDCLLIAALVAGRLVPKRRRQLAWIGLALVTLYIGGRIELRSRALYHLSHFEKAAVSPLPIDPFRWVGLIDNPNDVRVVVIDAFNGIVGGSDQVSKAPASEAATRASQSRSGTAFRRFARFPVTKVRNEGSGYLVIFFDVRYYNPPSSAFGARIHLDSEFRVTDESLSFTQRLE